MFIYARSEQCELGPIYTKANMQRIRIYPGKLKFIAGVGNLNSFFARGLGNSPIKKIAQGDGQAWN